MSAMERQKIGAYFLRALTAASLKPSSIQSRAREALRLGGRAFSASGAIMAQRRFARRALPDRIDGARPVVGSG